jgi:hypothetical protein
MSMCWEDASSPGPLASPPGGGGQSVNVHVPHLAPWLVRQAGDYKVGGQSLHVHVLGRRQLTWPPG